MSTRRQGPTMAELVAEVELRAKREAAAPRPEKPVPAAGAFSAVVGVRVAEVDPERALALAEAEVTVVWDPCGCGGGCGFETWSGAQVKDLVVAGPPVVRRGGSLSERRDDSGRVVLLVEGDVRWGPLR